MGPATAGAQSPSQAACIEAYTKGQELEQAGALREARTKFLVCGREPCSKVLVKDCILWIDDVERKMPTVVVEAHGTDDVEVNDVRVFVDDDLVATRLDGRAIDVNPGPHTLRFVREGAPAVEQRAVMREGEKGRKIVVAFGPARASPLAAPPPPPAAARRRDEARTHKPPWLVYPLAGVGAVGLGGSAYFGLHGLSQRADLDGCKGFCASDPVSDARRSFLFADISLGVALISLGAAAVLFLTAD